MDWDWIGYSIPYHRGHLDHPHERRRLKIEKDFYDFIRTHPRPKGPLTRLGFLAGHLDGWHGCRDTSRSAGLVWNNPDWLWDAREWGWDMLKVLLPNLKFTQRWPIAYPKTQQHWTTDTPYGKVDIVPSKSAVDVLSNYAALFIPGWHTMDEDHYTRFKEYVEQGGILLMAVPQLSGMIRRDVEPKPWRDGDVADLFGVIVKSKGHSRAEPIVKQDEIFGLPGFSKRENVRVRFGWTSVPLAEVDLKDATPVITDARTGSPILVEHKLGKGKAYLLTMWAYPGEPELKPLMTDLITHLAEATVGNIRVRGSEKINYGVFTADNRWGRDARPGKALTTIYLTDIDWWTLGKKEEPCTLSLGGRDINLHVSSGDILQVAWYGDIAVEPRDKMVYVEKIERKGDTYEITLQGAGTEEIRIHILAGEPVGVKADGQALQFKRLADNHGLSARVTLTGRNVLSLVVR